MKTNALAPLSAAFATFLMLAVGCNPPPKQPDANTPVQTETPEYFMLRPSVEKAYGYTHAVRIGDELKISGAVSMDDKGNLTAPGDLKQQMINCYADLDKILKHYGYTWDDVVVENVLTPTWPNSKSRQATETQFTKSNSRPGRGLA